MDRSSNAFLSSAIPLHDEATIIRYSRTMFTFKIINSFVYTGLLYIILSYYFSTLNDPYKTAYYYVAVFTVIQGFGGFAGLYSTYYTCAERFDVDFFISLVTILFTFIFADSFSG